MISRNPSSQLHIVMLSLLVLTTIELCYCYPVIFRLVLFHLCRLLYYHILPLPSTPFLNCLICRRWQSLAFILHSNHLIFQCNILAKFLYLRSCFAWTLLPPTMFRHCYKLCSIVAIIIPQNYHSVTFRPFSLENLDTGIYVV